MSRAAAKQSGAGSSRVAAAQQHLWRAGGGEDEDVCPVCKSSRYLNPTMRFLVNPECYHRMCESCVDRLFSHGPAPCPVAGCHRTLRKHRFRKQTFESIQVEREVDIRKRIAKVFNRRQDEFESLRDYNDYLEEVECITFNLINGIDVAATEAKLAAYAAQNVDSIAYNSVLEEQESASFEAHEAAERERARLRRDAARREAEEERQEREEGRRDILNQLAHDAGGSAEKIARDGQRVLLKRSTARRNAAAAATIPTTDDATNNATIHNNRMKDNSAAAAAAAASASASLNRNSGSTVGTAAGRLPSSNGSAEPSIVFKGLKPRVGAGRTRASAGRQPLAQLAQQPPPPPYDAFGGARRHTEYFVLQPPLYEHPWLHAAQTDPAITAGGYSVAEYYARSLAEAFAGLGVFVGDEMAQRQEEKLAAERAAQAPGHRGERGDGTAAAAAAVAAGGAPSSTMDLAVLGKAAAASHSVAAAVRAVQ